MLVLGKGLFPSREMLSCRVSTAEARMEASDSSRACICGAVLGGGGKEELWEQAAAGSGWGVAGFV